MNTEQLQVIKERLDKATPGTWQVRQRPDGAIDIVSVEKTKSHEYLSRIELSEIEDAQFIAYAHQDIPGLIAEIERLQISERNYIDLIRSTEGLVRTASERGREIERLRKELDNAAEYISIGESAKANDIICRALGVDSNHYGIYGEEEE